MFLNLKEANRVLGIALTSCIITGATLFSRLVLLAIYSGELSKAKVYAESEVVISHLFKSIYPSYFLITVAEVRNNFPAKVKVLQTHDLVCSSYIGTLLFSSLSTTPWGVREIEV